MTALPKVSATARCDHGFLKSKAHQICPTCSKEGKIIYVKLPVDMTGFKIGLIEITGPDPRSAKVNETWFYQCVCGNKGLINRHSINKAIKLGHMSACPSCRAYTKNPKRNGGES